jgi:hypothetical protein
MLELIWGKGYMAPGGPRNVAKLLNGIDTHGKRILDIGCGIGGPAFDIVISSGFDEVVTIDATEWYRDEVRREYELIQGGLFPRMVELLGQAAADHFVENWRTMLVVIEKNEMQQGYCRGRRPVEIIA